MYLDAVRKLKDALEEHANEVEYCRADASNDEQRERNDGGDDEFEFTVAVRVAGRKLILREIGRRCVGCHMRSSPIRVSKRKYSEDAGRTHNRDARRALRCTKAFIQAAVSRPK